MAWKQLEKYPNYSFSHLGKIKNLRTGKVIFGYLNEESYRRVSLYHNGIRRSFYLHRIIAFLFVPNANILEYNEVHHLNNKRDDNKSSNLKWVNHTMNMKYIYTRHITGWRYTNQQSTINLQYI